MGKQILKVKGEVDIPFQNMHLCKCVLRICSLVACLLFTQFLSDYVVDLIGEDELTKSDFFALYIIEYKRRSRFIKQEKGSDINAIVRKKLSVEYVFLSSL